MSFILTVQPFQQHNNHAAGRSSVSILQLFSSQHALQIVLSVAAKLCENVALLVHFFWGGGCLLYLVFDNGWCKTEISLNLEKQRIHGKGEVDCWNMRIKGKEIIQTSERKFM
jgi:hypothetical protein